MADYMFKVKLLIADLDYPAFYYRQSIHDDKINSCFEDLRDELMRRYDLRVDIKGNFKLHWYHEGDVIAISNNEDLKIFMELKGTRVVVVRQQINEWLKNKLDTNFVNFKLPLDSSNRLSSGISEFENQKLPFPLSLSSCDISKPPLIANSVSVNADAGSINEQTAVISETIELSDESDSSLVNTTISMSCVFDNEKDQQKHAVNNTHDSSPIPELVSVNSSIHVWNDQSKNTSSIPNVAVTSPIPDLGTDVDGVRNEDDKPPHSMNVSISGDSVSSLDADSVNANEDDQPKNTNASNIFRDAELFGIEPWSNRKTYVDRQNESLERLAAVRKTVRFELPAQNETDVSSSVPLSIRSNKSILSHKEIMAKIENLVQYELKTRPLKPLRPNILPQVMTKAPAPELSPITAVPVLSSETPSPKLQQTTMKQNPNPRVREALNTMTSTMKFSNSGGWLERLLETVDGNIDEAMKKLQPKLQRPQQTIFQ